VRPVLIITLIGCLVLVAAVVAVEINIVSLPSSDDKQSDEAQRFFGPSRQYDTTGGQEMKPRWNN
jgi:Ti type entry exclusion protein TrbK